MVASFFDQECSLKEVVRREDKKQIIEVASSAGCDMIVLGAQHKHFRDTTVPRNNNPSGFHDMHLVPFWPKDLFANRATPPVTRIASIMAKAAR